MAGAPPPRRSCASVLPCGVALRPREPLVAAKPLTSSPKPESASGSGVSGRAMRGLAACPAQRAGGAIGTSPQSRRRLDAFRHRLHALPSRRDVASLLGAGVAACVPGACGSGLTRRRRACEAAGGQIRNPCSNIRHSRLSRAEAAPHAARTPAGKACPQSTRRRPPPQRSRGPRARTRHASRQWRR